MTRLLSDLDTAHKRMLRNPVAFTDAIASAIGKAERGAHRHKHRGIAMCVGIAREVREDFALFEELRNAACLKDNKKVQAATAENFKRHVPFAVATRSFTGTEATENRIRVYGYVTGYFVKKSIAVPRIGDKIKAMDGIDGVYKRLKAKKREEGELQDETESAGFERTESRASDAGKREPAAPKSAEETDERQFGAKEPSEASRDHLTVKAILKNYLLVKMPTKDELERYRDGSARRGQRRQFDAVYRGTDENKLHVWEYIYGRDVNTAHSGRKDNDNTVDYENEDEDAA